MTQSFTCLNIQVGSAQESNDQIGLAKILSNVLLNESEKYPEGLSKFLTKNNGLLGISSDIDHTTFSIEANTEVYEEVIKRLSDLLMNPRFNLETISKTCDRINEN